MKRRSDGSKADLPKKQYPANPDYEYTLDDIFLIIDAYLKKENYIFQSVINPNLKKYTLMGPDGLTVDEAILPSFILKKTDNKPLLYKKNSQEYTVVFCGDSQSFDFSTTTLNKAISYAIKKKETHVCVFPFHLGFSTTRQGGHWNIAALFINGEKKVAKLWNIEPLGKVEEVNNDPPIIESPFYKTLQSALPYLTQVTKHTAQQNDAKLCGAVAAENASFFWGCTNVLNSKYDSPELSKMLRKHHIELSQSENFAKRQFENWVFKGYKNDDYEKANGEEIWYTLRKLQLENPGDYSTDFSNLLRTVNKWESEATEIKQCLTVFFEKHSPILSKVHVAKELLVLKFFKDETYKEIVSEYSVIELLKCLATRFENRVIEQPLSTHSPAKPIPTYKRNQGYSNTYRGDEYQKLVGMHFALNLYLSKKPFKLFTENAEETYNFGKFDDLIIETADQFEVVQVKHAGSMEKSKQVYTVDMLSAVPGSKQEDIKKKAAFHSYYDSWRECKDKGKPIVFRFYTNHHLDGSLKNFYDETTHTYQGLLKPQKDPVLQANQKKLIDSIYHGSEYFSHNVAKTLLGNLGFITGGLQDADWKKFIDDNYQNIFNILKKGGHFTKPRGDDTSKYQKIAFLLIGHFGVTASYDKIEITVLANYFTKKFTPPIHQYLQDKLNSCANKHLILRKKVTFTQANVSQEQLIKIIFPTEANKKTTTTIAFPTATSAKLYIKDAHAAWCLALLFGRPTAEIPYGNNIYNLNEKLQGKLSAAANLPKDEFISVDSLDPSIPEFLNVFNFQVEQPSINALEKQNFERIRQRFQVEDHTYYLMFERYFLENFRAPLGEVINFDTLDSLFQNARREIQRSRLIGYVQRYLKEFKTDGLNVVTTKQLKAVDEAYHGCDNIITILSGAAQIGKSFTVLAWIEKYRREHSELLEDSYAFLPIRDIWDTDIDLFIHKLQLLVIDNVEDVFGDPEKLRLLEQIIWMAKEHRKKIILIVSENKKIELGKLVNGIPHRILDCVPLRNPQIFAFNGVTPHSFLVIGNLFVQLQSLLTNQNDSGLALAMRNPGLLQRLLNKKYIHAEKPKNIAPEGVEILIKQFSTLKEKIDFFSFIQEAKGPILVFHPNTKEFLEKLKKNGINQINISETEWPKTVANQRLAVICPDLQELPSQLKERNDLLIITSSEKFFRSPTTIIKHQCHFSNNDDHCQVLQTPLHLKNFWIRDDTPKDYMSVCEVKKSFLNHKLVSVDAGMGKTTLVKKLCQTDSQRQLNAHQYHWYIPVYLDQLVDSDNQKSLSEFVFGIAQKIYRLPDFFQTVIAHDLKIGNLLLVLDGGDQIKEEQLLECRELYDQLISYAHVVFLTRPNQSRLSFNANQELTLQAFTDEQIKKYFHKAFPIPQANPFLDAAIQFMETNKALREMLGVPLQCHLFWQAWQPYYEEWRQENNQGRDKAGLIPESIESEFALIAIFQRFLESKFYIHFKRNLNIKESLLKERERVNALSMSYRGRFAHVAVWEHFSDMRPLLQTKLPHPTSKEWLDSDITAIALIKRVAAPHQGTVNYVMAHRTYQEYAAAQYFVEGIMGLRQMHPHQKKWCKELLSIARFVHNYQQFWRFVLNWIQYHISLDHLPPEALGHFEASFKTNGDLRREIENDFWGHLVSKKNEFPKSYTPVFIPPKNDSEKEEMKDQTEDYGDIKEEKVYSEFAKIEEIIKNYQGNEYMRHDSEVYQAIDDLPNHLEVPKESRLQLLKYAQAPEGKYHGSYRIHEVIARSLYQLKHPSAEACTLLFSYYWEESQDSNIFRCTKEYVLQAAKEFPITQENKHQFLELLQSIQTHKDFHLKHLKVVNQIFRNFFDTQLNKSIDNLWKKFEAFISKLKEISNIIQMNKHAYDTVKDFVSICGRFGQVLTIEYMCSFGNLEFSVMLIYAQHGEKLIPDIANQQESTLLTDTIRKISKDSITKIIIFVAEQGYNAFYLLRLWLGIEYSPLAPLDDSLYIQEVDRLVTEKSSNLKTTVSVFSEIDAAIPSVCELQGGFNIWSAAYLISLMDNTYWQYPSALAGHIPRLLKYSINNNAMYGHLAIHVYHMCFKKIVLSKNWDDDLCFTFFNNSHANAYIAMDYAWQIYTNTGSVEAVSLIASCSDYLHWPLFKASQAMSLHLVTPATGHVREFKAKDKPHLRSTVSFFKQFKSVKQEDGHSETEQEVNRL